MGTSWCFGYRGYAPKRRRVALAAALHKRGCGGSWVSRTEIKIKSKSKAMNAGKVDRVGEGWIVDWEH